MTLMKRKEADMSAPSDFDAAVDAVMKSARCLRLDAMSSARLAYPDLFKVYQEEGPPIRKIEPQPNRYRAEGGGEMWDRVMALLDGAETVAMV